MNICMWRRTLVRAAAGAALAALSTVAVADIMASASLTEMRFTLIDLRPNDGITPQVTFESVALDGRPSYIRGTALDTFHGGFNYQQFERSGKTAYGEAADSRAMTRVGASAHVIGGSANQRPGLTASGYTHGNLAIRDNAFDAWAYANDAPLEFKLTPYTTLVWSADYALDTQTTHGYWNAEDGTERAFARTTMGFYDGHDRVIEEADHFQYATFRGQDGQTVHNDGLMSVSVTNRGGDIFSGSMASSVGVYGEVSGYVGSVPEPSTYAMMLGGLALVGAVVRRRRAQQR